MSGLDVRWSELVDKRETGTFHKLKSAPEFSPLAAALALGVVCLAIYPIGKKLNLRIHDELVERRKQYAAQTAVSITE